MTNHFRLLMFALRGLYCQLLSNLPNFLYILFISFCTFGQISVILFRSWCKLIFLSLSSSLSLSLPLTHSLLLSSLSLVHSSSILFLSVYPILLCLPVNVINSVSQVAEIQTRRYQQKTSSLKFFLRKLASEKNCRKFSSFCRKSRKRSFYFESTTVFRSLTHNDHHYHWIHIQW